MQLNTLRYLINRQVILTLTLLGLTTGSFIALTVAQAEPAPSGYKLVWSDEFSHGSLDTSKWSVTHQTRSTESHHQGRYLNRNTKVANGNLEILTERHCLSNGELPSDSNRSNSACPSGKTTAYSSGQVKTDYNWNSGKIEIRAKLPETTQSGLWSGYWLRQKGTWCSQQYGEIDILEWYSDPKSTRASTATTHISCANDKLTSRQHIKNVSGSLADDWHVWGVEWDKTGVTYYLDGAVVPSIASHRPGDDNQNKDTPSDFDGVSQSLFDQVINQPWQLRINTQVYPSNDQWHEAPDNSKAFTPQTMLVDYVRVYTSDNAAATAPVTPDNHDTKPQAPSLGSGANTGPAPASNPKPAVQARDTNSADVAVKDETRQKAEAKPQQNQLEPGQQASQAKPDTNTSAVPLTLPQTGLGQWALFGGLPLALLSATSLAWHHSRLKIK